MITSLRLENCQSWEDGTINFGPGLNAIIAGNNVGKSVIFKIIKITCDPDFFNKQERCKLIRYGSDFARATFTFSDNAKAITLITDKKVMYEFHTSDGQVFYSEEQPLNQTLEHLSVIVEENSKYMVNVLDSEQSLLLVKSDKKANSDLMKVITEHKGIERLTNLFTNKLREYSDYSNDVREKFARINHRVTNLEFNDLDKVQSAFDTLGELDGLLEICEFIEEQKNIIEDNLDDSEVCDWSVFANLLNQVERMEVPSDFSWSEILELLKSLPEEHLNQPEERSWEAMTELLKALPESKLTIPSVTLPLTEIKRLLSCYEEVDLNEIYTFNGIESLVNMKKLCDEISVNLNRLDKIKDEISEIKKIDFNGTVYDCPVHGKIVYNNGKCEVAKHG